MKKRITIGLVGIALCATASAADKVRLHFEEGAVGEQTTSETRFVNAASPGVYEGRGYQQNGGTSTLTMTGDWRPFWGSGFGADYFVYDPASGGVHTNTTALYLGSATTGAYGTSGVFGLDDDAALYGDRFTVEFFMRSLKAYSNPWTTFCSRVDADGAYTFVLRQNGGTLVGNYVYLDGDTPTTQSISFNTWAQGAVNDERWHHVALVYDATDASAVTFKVYVDYGLAHEKTLPGKLNWGEGAGRFVLGCGRDNYGYFKGWVDELRLSDEALSPDRFLRLTRVDRDDVYCHLTFNPIGDEMAPIKAAFAKEFSINGDATAYTTDGEPPASFATIRTSATAESRPNAHVFHLATANGADLNLPLTDEDILTNGDFTVEFFYKVPTDGANGTSYLVNLTSAVRARFEGNSLYTLNENWSKTKISSAGDQWHHLAYVVDRAAGRVTVYLDYAQKYYYAYTVGNLAASTRLCIGAYSSGANRFKDLWLDEVRVTKRALAMEDFIRPTFAGAEGPWTLSFSTNAVDFATYGMGLDGLNPVTREAWGLVAVVSTNLPSARIYSGDTDQVGVVNEAAARFANVGSTFSGYFRIPDDTNKPLASASFTAEMFFYANSFGASGEDRAAACFLGQVNAFKLTYSNQNGIMACGPNSVSFGAKALTTKKWYHFAYVQDVEQDELRFYMDRKLVATKRGIPAASGAIGDALYLMCNPSAPMYGCFTNAFADELRLTRAALGPESFLRMSPKLGLYLILR